MYTMLHVFIMKNYKGTIFAFKGNGKKVIVDVKLICQGNFLTLRPYLM